LSAAAYAALIVSVKSGRYDAMPERMRAAILLGAFAGLRVAEACGLRVSDVDFRRGVISPASATTTLNPYGHRFPDQDEATRSAVEAVLVARADSLPTSEIIAQRSRRSAACGCYTS
jgi:integrase